MVEINDSVVKIVTDEGGAATKNSQRRKGRSLTLGPVPVPLTIAILPGNDNDKSSMLLADPNRLEEDVASGNAATAVCNTEGEVVEFRKTGSGS